MDVIVGQMSKGKFNDLVLVELLGKVGLSKESMRFGSVNERVGKKKRKVSLPNAKEREKSKDIRSTGVGNREPEFLNGLGESDRLGGRVAAEIADEGLGGGSNGFRRGHFVDWLKEIRNESIRDTSSPTTSHRHQSSPIVRTVLSGNFVSIRLRQHSFRACRFLGRDILAISSSTISAYRKRE